MQIIIKMVLAFALQLSNYPLIWNRSLGTHRREFPKHIDDFGSAFQRQFTNRTGLPMPGSPPRHIYQPIEIRSYLYLAHLRRCWPQTTIYWECSPFAVPAGGYRRRPTSDRRNLGTQLSRYVPVSYSAIILLNYDRMATCRHCVSDLPESRCQLVWYPRQGFCRYVQRFSEYGLKCNWNYYRIHVNYSPLLNSGLNSLWVLVLTMHTSPSSLQLPTTFQHCWSLCRRCQILRWLFAWIRCLWMLLQSWRNGARLMVSFSASLLNVCFFSFVIYYILRFYTTVESYGKANLIDPIPAYPDLIASICYTSVRLLDIHALELLNFYPSFREQPATPKVFLHIF